ncbi:MAG: hypothetical protein ABIJ09_24590 [Pseudomonadota bacterium]
MQFRWMGLFFSVVIVGSLGCPPVPAGPTPTTPTKAVCGDNNKQKREVCDGSDLDAQSCLGLGFGAGLLRCQSNCGDFDRSGCGAPAGCGDGTRDGVELCDGGDLGTASCEALGYGAGSLSCLANCAGFDTRACGPPPGCGDNDRAGVEVCDGQDFGGLRCSTLGLESGTLSCASDCLSIDTSGCGTGCSPVCGNRVCGPDPACGESCGTCSTGSCDLTGQCVTNCTPDCSGRQCGADPVCNISCGDCTGTDRCTVDGECVPCSPDCGGRACGPDPVCGQSCGSCDNGTCDGTGQCVCVKECGNRVCGPDPLCGESCGTCSSGICVDGSCQQNRLCDGYSSTGRLGACEASCGAPFSCVTVDFQSKACLDTRPCDATPAARCCGTGEFCGTSSGISLLPSTFCCVPGEVLGNGLFGALTCADAGAQIGCGTASDCPADWGIPHCATQLDPPHCVECLLNSHCSSPTAGCDTATGTCVQCTSNTHCGGATPACDLTSHTCVQCTDSSFCGGSTPHCSSSQRCVACTDDAHCTSPTADWCVNGLCVECRNEQDCTALEPYCHYNNTCAACPGGFFGYTCTPLVGGREGCWPMSLLEPQQDDCSVDGDCQAGDICGAPTGKFKGCLIPCQ